MVLAFCILGDGNRETVGNDDEVLRVGNVWNPRDARVRVERGASHVEGENVGVGEGKRSERGLWVEERI